MKARQFTFLEITKNKCDRDRLKKIKVFGGNLAKGRRKVQRPISTTKWMHLTLKSKSAKGHMSLLNPRFRFLVDKIIKSEAKKSFILIGDSVNMGTHIHLQIKCKSRSHFQKFLRIITGKIAMLVTGAKKGKSFGKRFWDELAFTRIVSTSIEEKQLAGYLKANKIERQKGYQARIKFLNEFNYKIRQLISSA